MLIWKGKYVFFYQEVQSQLTTAYTILDQYKGLNHGSSNGKHLCDFKRGTLKSLPGPTKIQLAVFDWEEALIVAKTREKE